MRGLARERKLGDIGARPPFRLTRYAGGEITLTDTSTGKRIDLGAFGSTNTEAFARLLKLRSSK
jgi:putative photosynthetic complex assembly protein